MTRIVVDLENFKTQEPNKAIIPSIRLFTVGRREFIDLLSKERGDLVSSMHCTHLINRRSFEAFEEKIDSRFAALEHEEFDAVILEIAVDRKARLNKFYWIKCTPDLERGIDISRLLTLAACMKQGRSIEQARLLSEQTHFLNSLDGAGLTSILLVSVSTRPEDYDGNLRSLSLIQNLETDAPSSTKRARPEIGEAPMRFTHTERLYGETRGRSNSQNLLESKLSKLVNTYKSVGFEDEDDNSEQRHQEYNLHSKTSDTEAASSIKMLRTQRKMHAIEKRIEEHKQATQEEADFKPIDTTALESPLQ